MFFCTAKIRNVESFKKTPVEGLDPILMTALTTGLVLVSLALARIMHKFSTAATKSSGLTALFATFRDLCNLDGPGEPLVANHRLALRRFVTRTYE